MIILFSEHCANPAFHAGKWSNKMIHFESLPDCAIVRLPMVRQLFGISSPTVWRWSKNGLLPQPIRVSGITGWQVGAIKKALKRHSCSEIGHV